MSEDYVTGGCMSRSRAIIILRQFNLIRSKNWPLTTYDLMLRKVI